MAQFEVAVLLVGKLGGWKASATELCGAFPGQIQCANANATLEMKSFAGFARDGIWRHVIEANRNAGVRTRVVLHSWNPELAHELDGMFTPDASRHDPLLPDLDKVSSFHLSIKRGMAVLDRLPAPAPSRVFVSRYDLLLMNDVPLLQTQSANMWLPHHCVPNYRNRPHRSRPSEVIPAEQHTLRSVCSATTKVGEPMGRRMEPPRLSRYKPTVMKERTMSAARDLSLFVLDYFFIATPEIARGFGEIFTRRNVYDGWLNELLGHHLPVWSHLYWAMHLEKIIPHEPIGYIMEHEVDFTLARFWRYGTECTLPTKCQGGEMCAHAARMVAQTLNETESLKGQRLWGQCPDSLVRGDAIRCPWFSQNCGETWHRRILAMGEVAGRFQKEGGGVPRQLIGAERCVSPACLAHSGTARYPTPPPKKRSKHSSKKSEKK